MENKQRVRKRENWEEFQHQNKRHSHADLIFWLFLFFPKKWWLKKLIWVRLCSFQPTDICACACMFARACARAERRFRRNCAFFATLCCNSCTHCVKTRQLDLCGHKYQGHYKDRQDLFVPRQWQYGYINSYDTDWKVFGMIGTSLDLTERRGCHGGDICKCRWYGKYIEM